MDMEQQRDSVCKTFTYKLMPTPEQERTLATVVWHCRELSNAGLQERTAAWEQCGVCVTCAMQSTHLPAIKAVAQSTATSTHRFCRRCCTAWTRRVPPASAASRPVSTPATRACMAAWAGKRVEAVPPAYTPQECSRCGKRVRKSLRVRTHVCLTCGLVLDRGLNAARTIHWRGQRLQGVAGVPAVPAVAGVAEGGTENPPRWSACGVSEDCAMSVTEMPPPW
jgi:transposase